MTPATKGPLDPAAQAPDRPASAAPCQDSTSTAGLRVASYHRVSTIDKRPELARGELRAAASRLGELVLEVEEVGSGARNDRPGWQRILDAARRGQLDVVVVWKADRAGRSTLDLLANIQQLQALNVRFLAITQGLDIRPGGEAVSKLLLTMLAAVAEFERAIISERTRLGLAGARRRGKRLGGRPVLSSAQQAQVRQLRGPGDELDTGRWDGGLLCRHGAAGSGVGGDLFGEPLLASAALDRLAHDAHQVVITGESYRTRATRKRAAEKKVEA